MDRKIHDVGKWNKIVGKWNKILLVGVIFIFLLLVALPLVISQENNEPVIIKLRNQGGDLEGHTPRGFEGQGAGLFVGDNLNQNFPNGDGIQTFLTFDLSEVPQGEIIAATLRAPKQNILIKGSPFEDLGNLNLEEIRFSRFSSILWNLNPFENSAPCIFATSELGPFECDVSSAIKNSRKDGYDYSQFRLSFDRAGDFDDEQDMALFFITTSNINQPGIFELELTLLPDSLAISKQSSLTPINFITPIAMVIIIIITLMYVVAMRRKERKK